MNLKYISLEAFRCFAKPVSCQLHSNGLHLISGPSGFGKTSLIEALAVALDYSSLSLSSCQSWPWLTEEDMRIELVLEYNNQPLTIVRSKKQSLQYDGQTTTSASTIKEKLPQILGIKPDILRVLTYRPQRQRGFFLTLRDAEKKEFLSELLKISTVETVITNTQKNVASVETKCSSLSNYLQLLERDVPIPVKQPVLDQKTVDGCNDVISRADSQLAALITEKKQIQAQQTQIKQDQQLKIQSFKQEYDAKIKEYATQKIKLDSVVKVTDADLFGELQDTKIKIKWIKDAINKQQQGHDLIVDQIKTETVNIERQLAKFRNQISQRSSIQTKFKQAKEAETAILSGICHACKRVWGDNPEKQEILQTHQNNIQQYQEQLLIFDNIELEIKQLEINKSDLLVKYQQLPSDPVPVELRNGLVEYNQKQSEIINKINLLQAQADAELNQQRREIDFQIADLTKSYNLQVSEVQQSTELLDLQKQIQVLTEQESQLNIQINQVKNQIKTIQYEYDKKNQQYLNYVKQLNDSQAKINQTKKEYDACIIEKEQCEDYISFLKSFISLIMEETLYNISVRANEMLGQISNVTGLTLEFGVERETKAGKVKAEIRPLIRKDGHEIEYKALSGGQQAVVELCVDMALTDVIGDRTGVRPGWLVLDEPFDGLGDTDKDGVMEILEEIAKTKAVYVIDHSCNIKDRFESVISIDNQDGVGYIS
jgi:DNA repair exonuclease SbcCD ATPase subunit